MPTVSLRVGGRDYKVACDSGEEDRLRQLADEVDERVQSLNFRSGGAKSDDAKILLLAALTMADELIESKKENPNKSITAQDDSDHRLREMEAAMAMTLDEIAKRIEKIADQIDLG